MLKRNTHSDEAIDIFSFSFFFQLLLFTSAGLHGHAVRPRPNRQDPAGTRQVVHARKVQALTGQRERH